MDNHNNTSHCLSLYCFIFLTIQKYIFLVIYQSRTVSSLYKLNYFISFTSLFAIHNTNFLVTMYKIKGNKFTLIK
ncbi:hypothetical protein Hanom_Chr05g00467441 [Helianthus anomalus]